MRLYTIKIKEQENVAVLAQNGLLYTIKELGFSYHDMNDFIINITDEEKALLNKNIKNKEFLADKKGYQLKEVTVCAPIPVPRQDIICLGVNYDEHINETKKIADFTDKKYTVYFSKRVNYAIGDGGKILHYDFVDSLDYEAELGVIIGKDCKGVRAAQAEKYIFGYTIINDISARNLQLRHQQWYMGKSLDSYTSIGPCIVTADEIDNVQNLEISCRVNDQLRQSSNTKYMIQPVADAIEELSQGITLKAGTVIATGTPGGVGMGMTPSGYLKSKDKVVCEIEKIGQLFNVCE